MAQEPTKFYVISEGDYSDRRTTGVFSTYELARAASSDNLVEEFILDNSEKAPGSYKKFVVIITRTGEVLKAGCDNGSGWGVDGDPNAPPYIRPRNKFDPSLHSFEFSMWAMDVAHAIKIANEKRIQFIANESITPQS